MFTQQVCDPSEVILSSWIDSDTIRDRLRLRLSVMIRRTLLQCHLSLMTIGGISSPPKGGLLCRELAAALKAAGLLWAFVFVVAPVWEALSVFVRSVGGTCVYFVGLIGNMV